MKQIGPFCTSTTFLSGSFFWGGLLILWGGLLIYLGLRVLFGCWGSGCWSGCYTGPRFDRRGCTGYHSIRKESSHIRVTNDKIQGSTPKLCFETRKGQAVIDLSALTEEALKKPEHPLEIQNRTRAGQTVFIISGVIPVEIHSTSAWGDTEFPDGTHSSFGTFLYRSHPDRSPLIVIHTEVRMGHVKFVIQ